ncbi:MAG: hypothetical protein LQ350_001983 [Teloschistes chrysophthalmus]|nr:MAG: hypothetical protein LQ350_001983 [Niorma chrysophthalma]
MSANLLQTLLNLSSKGIKSIAQPSKSTSDKSLGGGSSRIPGPVGSTRQRLPGFNPKLRMYCQDKTKPAEQAAYCSPSCPLDIEGTHSTGLYLHRGKPSKDFSVLFGANNPPPDIWLAHEKLMKGKASEEEEELILEFVKHHPFQPGNVTDRIWWTKDDPAQLRVEGNPLSHMEPEVQPITFEPIRVATVKHAGRETTFLPVYVQSPDLDDEDVEDK